MSFHARRTFRPEYSPPRIDSPRAIANATLLLTGARTIDHVTAESLAHQCRLKPKTAGEMLERERVRRAEQ